MQVKRVSRSRTLSSAILGIAGILSFAQGVMAQPLPPLYTIHKVVPAPGVTLYIALKPGESGSLGQSESVHGAIESIKADAAGNPCTIQFGLSETLDVGEDGIVFDGGEDGTDWGLITLEGKVTSSSPRTIQLMNGVSVNSTADIANTGSEGSIAFFNIHNSSLTISGGKVSATKGRAIYSGVSGSLSISGGTITAMEDCAVYHISTGSLTISGGTISATMAGATAIFNNSNSAVNISGGKVSATTGLTIYNTSSGSLSISGGTITTMEGHAVYHTSTGSVTISGGKVSATTGKAIYSKGGKITISGDAEVESANINPSSGTIHFETGAATTAEALVIEGGRVQNTASNEDSRVIYNNSTGAVTIKGGTVALDKGMAICNWSTGALNISGGKVLAVNGMAIYGSATGKITISGDALVTSANTGSSVGTIALGGGDPSTAERLVIEGGTVENTSDSENARAIFNASAGPITISGGKVLARNGYATYKYGTGVTALTGTGGLLFAYGSTASDVAYGGYTRSGYAVVVSWNKEAGNTGYKAGSSTDINTSQTSATVVWSVPNRISYKHGANNEGFIEIPGVTVSASTSVQSDARVGGTNPTGFVQVSGNALNLAFADRGNVAIYSIKGAKVRAYDLGSGAHTLRMDGLPRGTYMVRAVSGSWGQSGEDVGTVMPVDTHCLNQDLQDYRINRIKSKS